MEAGNPPNSGVESSKIAPIPLLICSDLWSCGIAHPASVLQQAKRMERRARSEMLVFMSGTMYVYIRRYRCEKERTAATRFQRKY